MKDQFVPYKLALKLKELGFDEKCFGVYELMPTGSDSSDSFLTIGKTKEDVKEWYLCDAPLWQQAFDWFWSKFDMWGQVFPWNPEINQWQITIYYKVNNEYNDSEYFLKDSDYEEAREACLEKLIELC